MSTKLQILDILQRSKLCNILHSINNPFNKETHMYNFFNKPFELDRTYQQVEGAIKSGYNFWLDVVADTIKMYKTK